MNHEPHHRVFSIISVVIHFCFKSGSLRLWIPYTCFADECPFLSVSSLQPAHVLQDRELEAGKVAGSNFIRDTTVSSVSDHVMEA